jgi:chloramphenicol O-acetyltransferase
MAENITKVTVEYNNGRKIEYDSNEILFTIFDREDTGVLQLSNDKWKKIVSENQEGFSDNCNEQLVNMLNQYDI